MSEMIERVARVICDMQHGHGVYDAYEFQRNSYDFIARAAIEMMHEPTDAMCEAGYSAGTGDWGGRYDNRQELARGRIQPGWQAMIDAALSPAERNTEGKERWFQ